MSQHDACRFVSAIMVRPHTTQLDGEGVCTYCGALRDRIRAQVTAGVLIPPDTSGGTIRDRMPVEPRPDIFADCAACGERFTMLVDQRGFLGTDGVWRFVHAASCWILLYAL